MRCRRPVFTYLTADSILAVLAQRLIRVLCPHCKTEYQARDEELRQMSKILADLPAPLMLYRDNGCGKCGHTGYKGRQAIFEVLPITDAIRSEIVAGKDAGSLSRIAHGLGYNPLVHHGFRKVVEGVTTLSEVQRVTSSI